MDKYNANGILEFFDSHGGEEYRSPAKLTDSAQRQKMENLYKESKGALGDFNQLLKKVADDNNLTEVKNKNFLDGSMRKIRTYFWGQMKNAYYFNDPESISLFAEKTKDSKSVFRVSLEFDQLHAFSDEIERFIKALELPLETGLDYYVSQHGHNNVEATKEKASSLKKKVESGEVEKVLIGTIVTGADDESVIKNINAAIKKIMPYYNHVLGIKG